MHRKPILHSIYHFMDKFSVVLSSIDHFATGMITQVGAQ